MSNAVATSRKESNAVAVAALLDNTRQFCAWMSQHGPLLPDIETFAGNFSALIIAATNTDDALAAIIWLTEDMEDYRGDMLGRVCNAGNRLERGSGEVDGITVCRSGGNLFITRQWGSIDVSVMVSPGVIL